MPQLVLGGTDFETIAATFMVTPAVVKQRLRLASVSPRLHEIYADDGMSLEQLMAFSVSDDHDRQEQVWELLSRSHNKQPYIASIVAPRFIYDPGDVARAGVFVSIDVDGSLYIERGYVRAEDEPAAEPGIVDHQDGEVVDERGADEIDGERQPAIVSIGGAPGGEDNDEDGEEQDDMLRPLPDRLVTELTTHRTLALRDAVANSPTVVFAAVLHVLVLATFYRYTSVESCMEVSVRGGSLSVHAPGLNDSASAQSIAARHDAWEQRSPDQLETLWDMLIGLDGDDQAALFAHCASFGVNAVWEPANRYNQGRVSAHVVSGRIEHSHVIARAANLDMVAAGWTATTDNYLGRVTKARILLAVEEAKGTETAGRIEGLKKPEMRTYSPAPIGSQNRCGRPSCQSSRASSNRSQSTAKRPSTPMR